jgi:hypothetical protein
MYRAALEIVLIAVFGSAGAAALHGAERKLTGAKIRQVLAGKTVTGTDDPGKSWTQVFRDGGITVYVQGSGSSSGYWEARGDQYCSQRPPSESWSCYDVTGDGDHATFISSNGKTWPIKVLP